MRTEYGYRGPSVIAVLLVSSVQQDHNRFEQILSHSKWEVHHANTEREGVRSATRHSVPTVICDCGLPDGTWQDMFAEFERIENGPNLIVTCGPADARLWAEALSLGAYDVLAKPFHDEEVIRVVRSAWRNWIDRAELRSVGAEKGAAAQRR